MTAPPDAPLRAARRPLRRLVGDTLTQVAQAVVTPLVPADYLDLVAPLRAGADLRARVVDVVPETPDAVTLVLRPGRAWAGHTAGQYVRILAMTTVGQANL